MSPKTCECGLQGYIIDSRRQSDHVMRRYSCKCGKRWTTCEIRLNDGVHGKNMNEMLSKQYSTADRDAVADKLIEIAQELLR